MIIVLVSAFPYRSPQRDCPQGLLVYNRILNPAKEREPDGVNAMWVKAGQAGHVACSQEQEKIVCHPVSPLLHTLSLVPTASDYVKMCSSMKGAL